MALCPIHASAVRRHLGCPFTFFFFSFSFPLFFSFFGGVLKWLSGQFMRLPFEDVLAILAQLHTREDIDSLHMCPYTALYLSSYFYMCSNTAIESSYCYIFFPSYCYICVLILLICALILLYVCPHTLFICPHTAIYVSSYCR